jgi:hypothetical protein
VFAGVDLAGPEIGCDEFIAAKDIHRQEAVVIVIAMEKPLFLMAVGGVVGCIEIEREMFRWLGMGGNELIDQDRGEAHECFALDAILQAAERGRRSERDFLVGKLPRGRLQRGIAAKGLMVVEILVAQGDRDDPLGEHPLLVMDDEPGISRVRNCLFESFKQTDSLADFAQEQSTGIGCQPPTEKINDH